MIFIGYGWRIRRGVRANIWFHHGFWRGRIEHIGEKIELGTHRTYEACRREVYGRLRKLLKGSKHAS
jgi:hypothetical protein